MKINELYAKYSEEGFNTAVQNWVESGELSEARGAELKRAGQALYEARTNEKEEEVATI